MSIIPGIETRRARADGHEQRVAVVAEPFARSLLQSGDVLGDLLLQAVRNPPPLAR